MFDAIDQSGVNAIRILSADMIQRAKSGHPGLPLGAAPMAYTLWTQFLNVDPATGKEWINRDRFLLSAGHGSALLYSLLHLSGYAVSMEDLKQFRQWHSTTPGHPEVLETDGVEATAGPLGQGLAMAVGMAMAEAHMAAVYNRDGFPIIDHYTYTLIGDGDLMEGISEEAISLAGHLKLNKLIVLYDSNDISLDGPLNEENEDDVALRMKASHWHYEKVTDGCNLEAIAQAITRAKQSDKPSLIEVKTIIGYGSPKEGSNKVHGAPLGEEGVAALRRYLHWDKEAFCIPERIYQRFEQTIQQRGRKKHQEWQKLYADYKNAYPDLAKQLQEAYEGQLPSLHSQMEAAICTDTNKATRESSSDILQAINADLPMLWGGSADLASSNKTWMNNDCAFSPDDYSGRNIQFGVREFAMGAVMNGIALHGGTRVYGSTFFVFMDYLKAAIRMAALQQLPVIYIFTHDSIAVGEDGPTHEPIEQLASLRAMPNVQVIRPCDANEVAGAWQCALHNQTTPTVLVLSRQAMPMVTTYQTAIEGTEKGAYIVGKEEPTQPLTGILIATGSEVALALQVKADMYAKEGRNYRVVSMPCMERFEAMDEAYKRSIIGNDRSKRWVIEMGATYGLTAYASKEHCLTIDTFGDSAPATTVLEQHGFTVDHIVQRLKMDI